MAPNLGLALVEVFGEDILEDDLLASLLGDYESGELVTSAPTVISRESSPVDVAAGDMVSLIQQANRTYLTAIQAQRDGDWAAYGQALAQLEAILLELETRTTEEE